MTVIFVFLCADCEVCDSEYYGHCTKHRPLIEFEDSEATITCKALDKILHINICSLRQADIFLSRSSF